MAELTPKERNAVASVFKTYVPTDRGYNPAVQTVDFWKHTSPIQLLKNALSRVRFTDPDAKFEAVQSLKSFKDLDGNYGNLDYPIGPEFDPRDWGLLESIDGYYNYRSLGENDGTRVKNDWDREVYNELVVAPLKEKAGEVRNTRLMGVYSGLPEGPESVVASYLTGIDKKSTVQQQSEIREKAKEFGLKGARRRKTRRKTRRTKKFSRRV
jgi:hypothetical protein